MGVDKIDKYLNKKESKVDEQNDEKKSQMYREGLFQLRSAFFEFSQNYMKAMGMMMQSKNVYPKYKKYRDSIATTYEKMDDSISKHFEILTKDLDKQNR